MDRRGFLKGTSTGLFSFSLLANMDSYGGTGAPSRQKTVTGSGQNVKPADIRLNIKPILAHRLHETAYEGSCRTGDLKKMTKSAEIAAGKELFHEFVDSMAGKIHPGVNILEPELIYFNDSEFMDVKVFDNGWKRIKSDLDDTDLLVVHGRLMGIEKLNVPVATMSRWVGSITNVDVAAYMKSRGMEGYAVYDWDDLNDLVDSLRVRKALANTKILSVIRRKKLEVPGGVYSTCDLDTLKEKYGIDHKIVDYSEFFGEMDKVSESDFDRKEAEKIVDKLVSNAQAVHMDKKYIINDVCFYLTAKKMMKKYGCNAFTIDCFELCGSQNPAKRQFVPCLTHTLLKDEGYISVCEGDLNAMLSMAMLSYTSGKSVYMGNTFFHKDKDMIRIKHNVPGLKMKGLEKQSLPYEIRNFANQGWGTGVRYEFNNDKGSKVTLSRFNPQAQKMLLTTATIEKSCGLALNSCMYGVALKVPDTMKIFRKQAETGHHFSMVYGDYRQQMKYLAEIMDFEIDEV